MHDRIKALNDEIGRLREQNINLAMEIESYAEKIDELQAALEHRTKFIEARGLWADYLDTIEMGSS